MAGVAPIRPGLVRCRTCGEFMLAAGLPEHQCGSPLVAQLRAASVRLLVNPTDEAAQKALRKALSEFA